MVVREASRELQEDIQEMDSLHKGDKVTPLSGYLLNNSVMQIVKGDS